METKTLLRKVGFCFKKNLGQNFITDEEILKKIVSDSGITENDAVVEIGAGAGTLTAVIAENCRKVISFETDKTLSPVLAETLKGTENAEIIFGDVLEFSDGEIYERAGGEYKIVSNLPYCVTTPVIMKFLGSERPPASLTLTVQKEVAERLAAEAGTKAYGAVTIAVALFGNCRITGIIDRSEFFPSPNVDGAVVRIDREENKYGEYDKKLLRRLVKSAFSRRRKTLVNNFKSSFNLSKEKIELSLAAVGCDAKIRGEMLTPREFVELSRILAETLGK